LTRTDVEALLDLDGCIAAVEEAFRQHGSGEAPPPGVLGVPAREGGFHLKAGLLNLRRWYFAAKVNGNFFGNPARGLPRIQGVIVLCDGTTGSPLAVMDSIAITQLRTAAATAVAARRLAREGASVATICGCGVQGRGQLRALARVLLLKEVFCFDQKEEAAHGLAEVFSSQPDFPVRVARDLHRAVAASDVIVTCTPSKKPFLFPGFLRPGSFVAAVGADSEDKQELDPSLMAASTIVTDVTEQCAAIGDLHHAIASGHLTRESVHGELGEIVAGKKPGRTSPDEIIVFDSTGMALQDVAAAATVYEKALAASRGLTLDISA
jgi:alanine dehydrogenase